MFLLLVGQRYTSSCSIRLSLCHPNPLCFMYILYRFLLQLNTWMRFLNSCSL